MNARATKTNDQHVRVAYLTSQYPATSHTFIRREVAALRKTGLHIETFSIRPPTPAEMDDEQLRAEAQSTFTVLRQPLTHFVWAQLAALGSGPLPYFRVLALALSHRPPGLRGLAMSFVYFAEALILARELERRKITHLHNHFANAGAIVGFLAANLLRLPWTFTMHGISETDYPAGLLLGRKIEAAEFVICVSYFGRAQAMRLVSPEHWSKLRVVRCGLNLDDLPAHAKDGTGLRIVSVGRLSSEKGQAGLLAAFASLALNYPGLELTLVGDGPQSRELRRVAERLGISDRVRFTGRLGETASLDEIAMADVLVVASFMEGMPIVLMEAMAIGTAVIASRVAGIPELVQHESSGLLFTPSNWEELADCIQRLVVDDRLRNQCVRRGKEAVSTSFDIRQTAAQLSALFADGTA